jgi:hypothetical protein
MTAVKELRFTPTVSQLRMKYESDLQLVGLLTLTEAERTSRPADYIATILDVIRDSYPPREATYLTQFICSHAEDRGLLDAAKIPALQDCPAR